MDTKNSKSSEISCQGKIRWTRKMAKVEKFRVGEKINGHEKWQKVQDFVSEEEMSDTKKSRNYGISCHIKRFS